MEISKLIKMIDEKVKGTTAISLITKTEVRMVKKDRESGEPNPFIGAIKIQQKNGLIGFDYKNSVNNQASREEKEERDIKKRAWGELSENRIWVNHKDNKYLQLKLQSVGETKYILDGQEIDYEDIKKYLSGSRKSSTQEDLDKQIIINDIKVDNIEKIVMFGESIKIN